MLLKKLMFNIVKVFAFERPLIRQNFVGLSFADLNKLSLFLQFEVHYYCFYVIAISQNKTRAEI